LNNVIKFRPIKREPPKKPRSAWTSRRLTWEPWAIFFLVVGAVYAYQHFLPF
jgi:hypothetical protein